MHRVQQQGEFSVASGTMWHWVGVCSAVERFHHAGLSPDGKHCLVVEADDSRYAVWDIDARAEIWHADVEDEIWPGLLNDLAIAGSVLLDAAVPGPLGPFRITGLFLNDPVMEHCGIRLGTPLWTPQHTRPQLYFLSLETGLIVQQLPYEDFSGDWAYPSFSVDGSTISVLTPYDVTFFRQVYARSVS